MSVGPEWPFFSGTHTFVLKYSRFKSPLSPLLPVHNWEPCGWDVYGVARPGSGQCPVFPAARSGLCSTGSHCDTGPSLSFPVINPSSLRLPFPPLWFCMSAQQERVPISPPPPVRLYVQLILSSSLYSPSRLLSLPSPPSPLPRPLLVRTYRILCRNGRRGTTRPAPDCMAING